MEEHIYQLGDIRLNVWEAGPGNGPVIIFLHGFPEAGFAWAAQVQFFAAKGCRVLAPDQRGYNKSSKPLEIGGYRIEKLVDDIVALINAVTRHKVVLVGHDWGGGVAWHLAMHYPQLLERLIILNMPHPQVMHQYLKHSGKQQLKSSYAGFFQLPLLPELIGSVLNYTMLERSLHKTSIPGTFSDELIAQYKKAWKQPGALTGMINWYRAYRFFEPKSIKPVMVPTLIIWGKKDAFLLPELAEQSMAFCSNSQLVVLETATHWLHHEQPGRINHLIWDFAR